MSEPHTAAETRTLPLDPDPITDVDPASETTMTSAADADADAAAAAPDASPAAPTPALRPRTRWAGIVWGLVLAATALAGIRLAAADTSSADVVAWFVGLGGVSPATAVGYGVLAIGALLLVTGLVGLLRRAQRTLAARRLHDPA